MSVDISSRVLAQLDVFDTETVIIDHSDPDDANPVLRKRTVIYAGKCDFQSGGGSQYRNPSGVVDIADAWLSVNSLPAVKTGDRARVVVGDIVTASLATASLANATTFALVSGAGVAAGDALLFADGTAAEYLTVASVSGNTVTTTSGAKNAHAKGVTVYAQPGTPETYNIDNLSPLTFGIPHTEMILKRGPLRNDPK